MHISPDTIEFFWLVAVVCAGIGIVYLLYMREYSKRSKTALPEPIKPVIMMYSNREWEEATRKSHIMAHAELACIEPEHEKNKVGKPNYPNQFARSLYASRNQDVMIYNKPVRRGKLAKIKLVSSR